MVEVSCVHCLNLELVPNDCYCKREIWKAQEIFDGWVSELWDLETHIQLKEERRVAWKVLHVIGDKVAHFVHEWTCFVEMLEIDTEKEIDMQLEFEMY
jgi:hypothetical protein